ncbi:MAG: hypothetical protein KDC38_06890 [Planctomycetes bacterium]|nr:hypothetical protein [Planctomycetota bacterium]
MERPRQAWLGAVLVIALACPASDAGNSSWRDGEGGVWDWSGVGRGGASPGLVEHPSALLPHPSFDLALRAVRGARDGALQILEYQAERDGRRVLGHAVRVVVERESRRVVVWSGRGVDPATNVRIAEGTGENAVVTAAHRHREIDQWSDPEAVWVRVGDELHGAWRLLGHERTDRYESIEIVIDGTDGRVLRDVSALRRFEVTGTVRGTATPGLLPDVAYNPAQLEPLGELTLQSGGVTTMTAPDGTYVIDAPLSTATVSASLDGPWVAVRDAVTGAPTSVTGATSAPGMLDLEFGPATDADLVGGVNCFIHVNRAHEFITVRNPTITGIDVPVPCEVGIPFPCVAAFDPFFGSLVFSTLSGSIPGGGFCAGLAMSTIIVHEYGHFVHLGLGIDDQAFGEGYGDALAALVFDDPVSGQDVFGPGVPGRDISTPDVQYPCSAPDPHECGLVLAGVWWDIKEALQDSLGATDGLEVARQLFVDWSAMTAGGAQSAHPGTAVEVLTVDDDNADLMDGTPNFDAICQGFALHGIDCPIIVPPTVELIRGDCNADGSFDVSDPVYDLSVQFLGEIALCDDACDVNDDGVANVADPVYALGFLFSGGPAPAAPYPLCGADGTTDPLDCGAASTCP